MKTPHYLNLSFIFRGSDPAFVSRHTLVVPGRRNQQIGNFVSAWYDIFMAMLYAQLESDGERGKDKSTHRHPGFFWEGQWSSLKLKHEPWLPECQENLVNKVVFDSEEDMNW